MNEIEILLLFTVEEFRRGLGRSFCHRGRYRVVIEYQILGGKKLMDVRT